MNTKPPAGGSNVSTNDSDITTREILEKRDVGSTKLQSEYKVRTIVLPFDFMEQPTRIGTMALLLHCSVKFIKIFPERTCDMLTKMLQ